jgi:phosphoglycerate dehydrogenase-like enzyme
MKLQASYQILMQLCCAVSSMHEHGIPASIKAIARAGAGVNNIPVEKCTEKGIVVFNTPGANANAVKELVIAGMLLASRDIVESVVWAKTLIGKGSEVPALVEKGKNILPDRKSREKHWLLLAWAQLAFWLPMPLQHFE